ncbi:MAG: hypothetical protein IJ637_01025 [Prevotella sp.]|nr:hypothetical protein [Prevotella sp.]
MNKKLYTSPITEEIMVEAAELLAGSSIALGDDGGTSLLNDEETSGEGLSRFFEGLDDSELMKFNK